MTEMPLPHLRPPALTTSSSSSPYSSSEEKSSASWSATGFLRRLRVEEKRQRVKASRQATVLGDPVGGEVNREWSQRLGASGEGVMVGQGSCARRGRVSYPPAAPTCLFPIAVPSMTSSLNHRRSWEEVLTALGLSSEHVKKD